MKTLPAGLTKWVDSWVLTQGITTKISIEPLAGDGSTRCFYRLRWAQETRILLSDPEWIFSKDYAAHQAYLTDCNIPVPVFFAVDPGAGFLVMEDLGDELLQIRLQKVPTSKMEWLSEASRLLARFHGETFPVPETLPATQRRFDKTKYFEELKHTQEHLCEKLLGLPPLTPDTLAKLENFAAELAKVEPIALSHRDYHTRNLLVHTGALFVIDFQDARLGPPHYDLASLLYDAYVPVSKPERNRLIEVYKTELRGFPKLYEKIVWAQLERDLSWVGFQRVVKAAGSFASFFTRNAKRTHLPYLVPALESARLLQQGFPEIGQVLGEAVNIETWLQKIKAGNWNE